MSASNDKLEGTPSIKRDVDGTPRFSDLSPAIQNWFRWWR